MFIFVILYLFLFKNVFAQMEGEPAMPMEPAAMGMETTTVMPQMETTSAPSNTPKVIRIKKTTTTAKTTVLPNPFNTLTNACSGLFSSLLNKGNIKCQALCTLSGHTNGGLCSFVENQNVCTCKVS